VDYGPVIDFKMPILQRSFERFKTYASWAQRGEFMAFCDANRHWLDDFALFMAVKDHFAGAAWNTWDTDIATRDADAVSAVARELDDQMEFHRYLQFQFSGSGWPSSATPIRGGFASSATFRSL